jgi:glycosyltransferase involved in cell wall biosynthesis
MKSNKPKVSVIITTKNEESSIARLLQSLKVQTYTNLEIIVVDNKSTDKTKKIAKLFTKKVYTKGPERSTQRNYGASKSKGKYLLFLDADMELPKNILRQCIEAIQKNKKYGMLALPEKPVAKSYWEKVKAFERSIYNKSGDKTTDAERFFTRTAFNSVGGYDESITGPEDWDLPESIKAKGYKSTRIKSKILHYERVPNPLSLARKKYYYALKAHRYFKKQNVAPISAKSIYFLRPVFYKNWKMLLANPSLTLSMFVMFTFELVGGGLGFIIGKYKNL